MLQTDRFLNEATKLIFNFICEFISRTFTSSQHSPLTELNTQSGKLKIKKVFFLLVFDNGFVNWHKMRMQKYMAIMAVGKDLFSEKPLTMLFAIRKVLRFAIWMESFGNPGEFRWETA